MPVFYRAHIAQQHMVIPSQSPLLMLSMAKKNGKSRQFWIPDEKAAQPNTSSHGKVTLTPRMNGSRKQILLMLKNSSPSIKPSTPISNDPPDDALDALDNAG